MNTFKRQFLLEMLRIFDLFVCIAAFLGAMILSRLPLSLSNFKELIAIRISISNIITIAALMVSWHILFTILGFYNSRRLSSLRREFIDIAKATTFSAAIIFIINLFRPIDIVDSRFVFIFGILLFAALSASRVLLRLLLKQLRKSGINLRHIVIVGTNAKAAAFSSMVKNNPELGYNFKGFIDDTWAGPTDTRYEQQIVSDFTHFKAYLRDTIIDEIFIFLPIQSFYHQINEIIETASEQGILVRMKTEFFRPKNSYPKIEYLENEMLLTYCTGQMRRRLLLFKKAFDFATAFALLVLVSPILLLSALAIKLTSPGPVFFVQERIGFNKRRFKLYKFRTMVPDAEKKIAELEHLNEIKGAAFKLKNDPRITPIGKILRKLSIDELPQLFNVLKGDMSLVGPRPVTQLEIDQYYKDQAKLCFGVTPGVTGLWQVSGRSNTGYDYRITLDSWYVRNWNLWLDIVILFKTVRVVLKREGAV